MLVASYIRGGEALEDATIEVTCRGGGGGRGRGREGGEGCWLLIVVCEEFVSHVVAVVAAASAR